MSSWGFALPKLNMFTSKSHTINNNSKQQISNVDEPMSVDPPPVRSDTLKNNKPVVVDDGLKRHEEGILNYKPGGYHPVSLGDVYNQRYKVLKKLGWGHFSTVWFCEDLYQEFQTGVAIKVQKSGNAYTEAAVDEIQLLRSARSGENALDNHVVILIDAFQVSGPNGLHHVMVFELLGENLLALLRWYSKLQSAIPKRYGKGMPIPVVQRIAREVLIALDYLHTKCRIIHTDLKPENVLLASSMHSTFTAPVEDSKFDYERIGMSNNVWRNECFVKVVDLGNACWVFKHFTDYITTRQYRSPEAIVDYEYSVGVDVWSLACIVFELITGEYLFDPRADKNEQYTRDEDHLALMVELLGSAPPVICKYGKSSSTFFARNGTLKNITDLLQWPLNQLLEEKFSMPKDVALELSSFLLPMLHMDPSRRASAADCLKHPWVKADMISQNRK